MNSPLSELSLDFASLRKAYASGLRPADLVAEVYRRIEAGALRPVWISLTREQAQAQAERLQAAPKDQFPLYGLPFAVKDNIDVGGVPTTAGCPDYAYIPPRTAPVVERLLNAGAILIGKTNLDQFATGLVGARSPYGACRSVFHPDYVSGGSSSGSAVAVANGLVSFSLGTDTAGSGRVPAAFNNIIGFKPSRGLLSAAGVVPACRTLDCVSVFALTSADARDVFDVAAGCDPADPFSRAAQAGDGASPWLAGAFRFGIPRSGQLEFFGDEEAASLYQAAVARMEQAGGQPVEIDYSPFRDAASLLYSGPWVAERLAAIRRFAQEKPDSIHPVVRRIILPADRYSAVDAFQAQYRLAELRSETEKVWKDIDVLMLPTTGTIYKVSDVEADPIRLNTNLGYYTNFVNLLDLSAVAVPAGFRSTGLPFGVTFIGRAFADHALLQLADRFHRLNGGPLGGTSVALDSTPPIAPAEAPPGCVALAVLGAHLTGQPLNYQLTERGAKLMRACRTAPEYRLYALSRTVPAKPGLVREPGFQGPGIEAEVWAVPEDAFGTFVAAVPPPLTIGTVTLEDGSSVKGFLCEPWAVQNAQEITSLGGWRAYLARRAAS